MNETSSKKKILYVDDEPINLKIFEINFKDNYAVYTAEDGITGLSILTENPDILIIISDMKMPRMTGIEFIEKAKAKFPDKKFYILTGFDITDEIKAALECGLILKYFSKPLDIHEMDAVMQEVIKDNKLDS